jgi:hypothetical protein
MWVELAERIIVNQERQADRNFCENLQSLSDLGLSLRLALPRAQGCAVSSVDGIVMRGAVDSQNLYRMHAPQRLGWLKRLRSTRPEMAEEFSSVLAKAEQAWQGCITRER